MADLSSIIAEHEKEINISYCGNDVEKVKCILNHYKTKCLDAATAIKSMQGDVSVWFRAVGIILETVANAATHGEKNARIRGLIEFVETSISKIRDMQLEHYYTWHSPDLWRSEYPVKTLMNENKELKAQIETMKTLLKQNNIETQELPF